MKNNIFARFARAFFIFWHFVDVLVLSTTWNDLFCSCVDDVSIWWQMLVFVFLYPKRWFQFNFRIVRTHFSSIMSLNNWKMFAETQSHIFRWRSRFRRRRVCLSSLLSSHDDDGNKNPRNLHIWQWKTVFLHALHVHFSFFDILKTFSFFLRREMTCFAVVWTTWAVMTNVQFCLLMSQALVPI